MVVGFVFGMGKKRVKNDGARWGKKFDDKRDWKEYNEKLVRRGELYLSLEFVEKWDSELKKMNRKKRGRPFLYPGLFIMWMALVHVIFFLPYRQMEGFLRALSEHVPVVAADYTTLFKRISNVELGFDHSDIGDDVVVAVDSTGVKVTNRGEWRRKIWRNKNKRGWIKAHICVDIKTKQILGLEVTDEKMSDSRSFNRLIDQANEKANIIRVMGDGAYDCKKIFNYLYHSGMESAIKLRIDATPFKRGSKYRSECIRERDRIGWEKWKETKQYGKRWTAESVFSAVKRMTGETVRATSIQGIIREVKTKFQLYNLLLNH